MSNPQRPDVSICVVTYRRPAGLARLLASVDRLKRPEGLGLEVIVVDNDPDAPPPPCRPDADPPLRWLRQGRNDLARARARAAAEARGEWVAFVDDDELLHEAWLAAYWEQAQRGRSDGLFGPVMPRFEGRRSWLDVETLFARPRQATGSIVDPWQGRTGNAFLRRHLFDLETFHSDPRRPFGEDTDLFVRLARRGARFAWCDEARVDEIVPPERMRVRWWLRRAFEGGNTHAQLRCRHGGGFVAPALRATALALAGCMAVPLSILAGRNACLQLSLSLAIQLGKLRGLAIAARPGAL